jgi:hypothetical protein
MTLNLGCFFGRQCTPVHPRALKVLHQKHTAASEQADPCVLTLFIDLATLRSHSV